MKTIFMFVVNILLSVICWSMALTASARKGTLSWKVVKSTHGITIGYKQDFWDYMNDKITEEEHSKKIDMYLLEI